jgi:hypothetical protein
LTLPFGFSSDYEKVIQELQTSDECYDNEKWNNVEHFFCCTIVKLIDDLRFVRTSFLLIININFKNTLDATLFDHEYCYQSLIVIRLQKFKYSISWISF